LPKQPDTRSATAFKTAEALVAEVRDGHAAPSDIARSVLDDTQAVDGSLNCFASLKPDDVMAQAAMLDQRFAKGEDIGPLAGLPVSVKDLLVAKGHPTTSGSRTMRDNVVDLDAPVVERLRRAGAVMLGKTTTSEFGCKAVGDSPLTGITRNPWDTAKTPGGSSCGGAALVASGITPVAIGTDGGGSLRIPASLNGLVGFKGHFGRVPAYPAAAVLTSDSFSSSFAKLALLPFPASLLCSLINKPAKWLKVQFFGTPNTKRSCFRSFRSSSATSSAISLDVSLVERTTYFFSPPIQILTNQ